MVNHEDVSERRYSEQKNIQDIPWRKFMVLKVGCPAATTYLISTTVFWFFVRLFQRAPGRKTGLWRQLCWWFWDGAPVRQQIKSITNAVLKTQDLNFRPTAQHKFNFIMKLEHFHILSITLLKHLCLSLHPAPFLWFYCTPKFAACLRFLHGQATAAPQDV